MISDFLQTLRTIKLGLQNVRAHKLRSALTVLGIVFGVCSVISMLAIGEGASQEIMEQYRQMGTMNVIVRSVKPPADPSAQTARSTSYGRAASDYGLRYADAERLASILPSVEVLVPIKAITTVGKYKTQELQVNVLGTVPWYPQTTNLEVTAGRFISSLDMARYHNVCVIGKLTARKLFFFADPIGKSIRLADKAYRVIGVVGEPRQLTAGEIEDLPSQSADIFVPLTTLRVYEGDLFRLSEDGSTQTEYVELHQLIFKIDDIEKVVAISRVIEMDLKRYHPTGDYKVVVPLQLLKSAERTQKIFSFVLASIAAISLLVGGIGIMNIMLASVSERTREIGIRRALGARRRDIMMQFLIECLILSIGGGVIGMGLGAVIPRLLTEISGIATVLTSTAFFISFGVSVAVGIVFGLYPARRAAMMDPIDALRHE